MSTTERVRKFISAIPARYSGPPDRLQFGYDYQDPRRSNAHGTRSADSTLGSLGVSPPFSYRWARTPNTPVWVKYPSEYSSDAYLNIGQGR